MIDIDPALHGTVTAIVLTAGIRGLIGCIMDPGWALGLRLTSASLCLAVGVWYLATWP